MTMRLLLISSSNVHGYGYLDHAEPEIRRILDGRTRVAFVPFALKNLEAYTEKVRERLALMGFEISRLRGTADLDHAHAVFVGGGNTFRLLKSLYDRDLAAGVAAAPFLLSGFLMPGALFLTVSARRHVLDRRVSAAVIVLFAACQFYLGYRSTAAMPLIAWMWLRHRAVRPFRWPLLAAWAMVLVFVVFVQLRFVRKQAY